MKPLKKILLLLTGLLFISSLQAQNALRISLANGSTFPIVSFIGDTFHFQVEIKNDSNTTFLGFIDLAYRVDTSIASGSNDTSGFEYFAFFDSIPPGDSIIRDIKAHINGPLFKTGPSVVVIWPIAPSGYPADSLRFNFFIFPGLGMNEADEGRWKAYVYDDQLQIRTEPSFDFRRVRILDVTGREIYNQSDPPNDIPLPILSKGIYILEVLYNNNRRKTLRFYKG